MAPSGLPPEEREMIINLLSQVRQRMLTPERLREFDEHEIFPEAEIRELLGPGIGLQLLFIPEAYGGLGGGARDMAATEAQKQKWLTRVAEGALVAYAVTEAEAGSNLSNLKTLATPVVDGRNNVAGYRLSGTKQFISNGGYADFLTVLAQTPDGPSFFIVEKTMEGFAAGRPEQKHGIRSSNTTSLVFDEVFVPAENLIGDSPGQGLTQANEVFGYTRLMVAALALGAGVAALDRVVPYARERIQFGSTLLEKQGYTHKLILPFVAKLEAARAYIEDVAGRLDAGETDLQAEGSLAKLYTTEVANACADAAIQALGGYGYVREYDVEKIKRDVKITTIYEGTSEIQQLIVSTFRWKESVKSKGAFYDSLARNMDSIHEQHPGLKADVLAGIVRLLNRLFTEVHSVKATRQQHVMFRLATLASVAETGAALTVKAGCVGNVDPERVEYLRLCARINTALCAQDAYIIANEILHGAGYWSVPEAQAILESSGFDYGKSQSALIADMDSLRTRI